MFFDAARPFLRPLVAMVLSLVTGFIASGTLWALLATLVPWLVYLVLRFGKYVVIVSVALVVAFFLLDVIAHETETLDQTLDWVSALTQSGATLFAQTRERLCLAWPRMPAFACAGTRVAAVFKREL